MILGTLILAMVAGYGLAALAYAMGTGLWIALAIGWAAGIAAVLAFIILRVRRVLRGTARPQHRIADFAGHLPPRSPQ